MSRTSGRIVALSINELHVAAEAIADALQHGNFIGRFDPRGAAAVGELGIGIGTDDGDGFDPGRVERQQVLILQQHKGFFGHLVRGFLMRPGAQRALRLNIGDHRHGWVADQVQFEHHVKIAPDLVVQQRHGIFAGLQPGQKRVGQIILVVGLLRPHFNVHAVRYRQVGVMHSAPVGHDKALESPFALENLVEQIIVFTAMLAAKLVVGAHDGQHARFLHARVKRRQIKLAQRALVHLHVD